MDYSNQLLLDIREGKVDINNTESFFGIIIKGLVYTLNKDILIRDIKIPHYILSSGSEYMYLEVKGQDIKESISNEDYIYSTIPRCLITLDGFNLETDQLTNPYSRGVLQFDNGENIYTLSGEMRRMPIKLSVNLKYYIDNFTDTLSLIQQWITKHAFVQVFPVQYLGQKIVSSYSMPESFNDEVNLTYDESSTDSKYHSVGLSLEIETNMPIYDPKTIVSTSNIVGNWPSHNINPPGYNKGWNNNPGLYINKDDGSGLCIHIKNHK